MARGKKKEAALSPEERLQAALVPENEQPYKVPENWCWTRIGELSTLYRGVSYKKQDARTQKNNQDYLILRGGNILEGTIDVETNDNVYVHQNLVQNEQLVQKYDIIIVSSTGSSKVIGRAGISHKDYTDVAFGAFLTLVRPNNDVVKPFIAYYFQSNLYRNRIRDLASGININNIKASYITESPIPFPPAHEQQRIVDRIESLSAKLDEAKQKAQDALDSFETRKAAILHRAFTGELTAQWRKEHGVGMESWDNKTLSQISKEIKAGGDKPDDFTEKSDEIHNIPVVANGITDEGIIGYTASARFEGETVTVAGRGTIGFSVYRTYPFFPVVRLIVIKPYDFVNAAYIKYSFDAFPESGTGSSIPQLTVPMVKQKEIPLPEINEQTEIVRILDNLLAKEQQAKEAAEKVLEQIDLTKKAILARAFRGELGTNDPSEESAIKLLEQSFSEAIEDKKVKHKQGSKQKEEVVFMPKTIMEALSTGARLTPENLKRQTELSIDDFYAQLKNLIDNGSVIESRENGESYLEAANEDRQAENQQL